MCTGDEKWKTLTKFWMKLFGVNFAIGVIRASSSNSNLAQLEQLFLFRGRYIQCTIGYGGILAFFLEATFIGVTCASVGRSSASGFTLASTWLAVIGATLSALVDTGG